MCLWPERKAESFIELSKEGDMTKKNCLSTSVLKGKETRIFLIRGIFYIVEGFPILPER